SCGYGGCPVLTVSPRFACACGTCQGTCLSWTTYRHGYQQSPFLSVKIRITRVEVEQHPGVAQGVRLDVFQVQELGHTFVVGGQEFCVDLGRHGGALDLAESVPGEEVDLESQAENPLQSELFRRLDQGRDDAVADGQPARLGV